MSNYNIFIDIPNFTGLDSPYEDPLNPEIILDTNSKTIEENIEYLMNKLDFSFIDIK